MSRLKNNKEGSNKILHIIFLILLLVTIVELGYYFLQGPRRRQPIDKQRSNLESKRGRESVVVAPTIGVNLSPNQEALDLLKELVNERSRLKKGVFLVDNSDNNQFFGHTGSEPIDLSSPFLVRIKFQRIESGDNTQLVLVGRRQADFKIWWKGISKMFIMDFHDQLRIELRDGRSTNAWVLIPEGLSPGERFFLYFFDPQGKKFAVLTGKGDILTTVDVTGIKKFNFSKGLFPKKKLWPEIILGPKAKMRIDEFSLSFVRK